MHTGIRHVLALLSFFSFGLLVIARAEGRTWHIRSDGTGDAPTIQAGIDSSSTTDSVLVGAGLYDETLDMRGKPLVLVGESGAEATVVDAGQSGRVLAMDGGVVEGLTLRNGSCSCNGAGVLVAPPGPAVIRSTIIEHNTAQDGALNSGAGGGVFIDPAAADVIVESSIVQNNFASVIGGGICDNGSLSTIRSNIVRNNTSVLASGGILTMEGRVTENLILGNVAGTGASGIQSEGPTEIRNNTIVRNIGPIGALVIGPLVFSHNIVAENEGTGIFFFGSNTPDCNDIWFNDVPDGGIWPGRENGNFAENPLFCRPEYGIFTVSYSSPCLPGYNPTCGLVGAFGAACSVPAVRPTTWGGLKVLYR